MTADGDLETFTYAQNGSFPNGTYTSGWEMEEGDGDGVYYIQYLLELKSDNTFTLSARLSANASGSNPSDWVEGFSGTYTYTGSQAAGGTLTLTATEWNSEEDDEPQPNPAQKKKVAKFFKK